MRDTTIADATRLSRAGDARAVLQLLRNALRRGSLAPEGVQSAGRLILDALRSSEINERCQHVLILGQCTTTWLTLTLAATSWSHGLPSIVRDGPYDNVLQSLAQIDSSAVPDILVLLPWHQRLLTEPEGDADVRIAQELSFWRQAWRLALDRGIKRIVQVGYDWVVPGARGYHLATQPPGAINLVRRTNVALREEMPDGVYFVPLEELSGVVGRQRFYDMRRQHWTRQPFSEPGLLVLSEHIVAGIRSLTTGPRKVLVLDLDGTLWGGIVGETGALGVELGDSPEGEAFRSFQHHVAALSRRGILLAVCSKNDLDDARGPFERNANMILRLDDFAQFVANWEPKVDNLRRIAADLRLGLDSFVFFDNDPFERDFVREFLPEVEVVDVPDDPSDYVAALQSGLWFETAALTKDDEHRKSRYVAESRRRMEAATATSIDEYLVSLGMVGDVRAIDETDMQRVVQLLAKTNQFNLTTRRHTADDVRRLLAVPRSIGMTLRLSDRMVDHGLVAVIIAVPHEASGSSTLKIDSLLMSCRVIGRTAEVFLLNSLLQRATELSYEDVIAEFVPTAKNQIVAGFYQRAGFMPIGTDERGSTLFRLALPARLPTAFVTANL